MVKIFALVIAVAYVTSSYRNAALYREFIGEQTAKEIEAWFND